jgi:predicted permease
LSWEVADRLARTALPIAAAMVGGYVLRRLRPAAERLAEALMAFVVVAGYPSVGLLTIWATPLRPADAWLPALGAVHVVAMLAVGLAAGRWLTADAAARGLFGIACGLGNVGLTMGGFVVYQLYGDAGLGRVSVLAIMWMPVTVVVLYPVARHYSPSWPAEPVGPLIRRSLLNWRAVGLPVAVLGIALSVARVPRPEAVARYHVVDVLVFVVTAAAYFSIGLRLHLARVLGLAREVAALAALRFGGGLGVGLLLVAATRLTPRPLTDQAADILLIESFVPTAVTMAAVANMFRLRPRAASVLFVTNTALYLALVLPVVFWVFG